MKHITACLDHFCQNLLNTWRLISFKISNSTFNPKRTTFRY